MLCCFLKAPKGGQTPGTSTSTHSSDKREPYCTHITASSSVSALPLPPSLPYLSFYCLINVDWTGGCSSPNNPRPRRHTLTLQYTLNQDNFAPGTTPNNLECTYVVLWLSWIWLLLRRGYCIYVGVTGVFTASYYYNSNTARITTHWPLGPVADQLIHRE